MNQYISKRKYRPRDLTALGLAITATLTGTRKTAVLRTTHRAWNWAYPKLRWLGTIGTITILTPWAAVAGIVYMIEQVLTQHHGQHHPIPEPIALDLPELPTEKAADPQDIPQIRLDDIPALQGAYDLPLTPPQSVPSPGLSVAPDGHSDAPAAQKPPRSRKRKEKATERTDGASVGTTSDQTPPATTSDQPTQEVRYRKKGDSYMVAKKRMKNETLYTRGPNGEYSPIASTVSDEDPVTANCAAN